MAIIVSTWRFEGVRPSLECVAEAFRERYSGETSADFDSHELNAPAVDAPEEVTRALQITPEEPGMKVPTTWRTAAITTPAGRIELQDNTADATITARLFTFDEAVRDALYGAMQSLGGLERPPAQPSRPVAESLITSRSRTLIKVFVYACYVGILTLLLLNKIGFLGAFGLLFLTWILRLALTLALGIRHARFMFTQILQRMPQQNAGAPKSVESRVVESTDVRPVDQSPCPTRNS